MRRLAFPIAVALAACGGDMMKGAEADERFGLPPDPGGSGPCGGLQCPTGFHCEFDQCVADQAPPPPPGASGRDPLASNRFVFALEVDSRRLVRVDSLTLEVEAFAAGLAPMDLAVIGSRELSVLLDALDIIEVLDHREDPPTNAAWTTARSLSHLRVSPSGEHVIAYFDWDDPAAQDRQPEPGNINQISVLALADTALPMVDEDPRLVNVAVGFLPRDVRFSADGTRAIIISRDTLTPVELLPVAAGVADPATPVEFDGSALEIIIDADAEHAITRYDGSPRVDVIDLATAAVTCVEATGPVTDIALSRAGDLVVSTADAGGQSLAIVDPAAATAEPCAGAAAQLVVGGSTRLTVDPSSDRAIAYDPTLTNETLWLVDLAASEAHTLRLEKAVLAVAWVGDGEHAHISHMKAAGEPAWDPRIEDPEVSVDKSFGVSWLNLAADSHRLAVSDVPFGAFTFVPGNDERDGATFQALVDDSEPQVLRVSHRPGFDDRWIDLAAEPREMGFLPETERTYVTQSHPWGRITFIDPSGDELRHVTGFALEVQ